jgi:Protein of unknown function (DUF2795)
MSFQRAAEIQVMLEGVPLPATKDELLVYAGREEQDAVRELQSLPAREYQSLDEVGEALVPVHSSVPRRDAVLPREESGDPPGGEAYLDADAEPGWVRPSGPTTDQAA